MYGRRGGDTRVSRTRREMTLRGLKTRRMDWREKQDSVSVGVKENQNRGADSFLHPDPVGALIQFGVVR